MKRANDLLRHKKQVTLKSYAQNIMKKYKVGILGATGTVGQKFTTLLQNHPWFETEILAAGPNSAGKTYSQAVENRWIMDTSIPPEIKNKIVHDAVKDAEKIAKSVDFVFCALSMNKDEIKILEEKYTKLECPVISNNSANRSVSDVPMIIPEINASHMDIIPYQRKRLGTKKGFTAVKSNCSIQCYVPALHPLFEFGIDKILVCTYQAISGAGKNFTTWPEMKDNIIPFIQGEEEKSEQEPLKIWGEIENSKIIPNSNISITSQCLRVPVTDGHTAAVFASFKNKISPEIAIEKLKNFKGHEKSRNLPSSTSQFITYFEDSSRPQIKLDRNIEKGMGIAVGRMRNDSQYDLKFVCMSHNTVRGAAGGAILLAEMLCREGYIS